MLTAQEVWICQNCRQVIQPDAAVCHSCGSVLLTTKPIIARHEFPPEESPHCPYCGQVIQPAAAVCHSCGSMLVRNG